MAMNRKFDPDNPRETGHGHMRVLPIVAIMAFILLAILSALVALMARGFRGLAQPDLAHAAPLVLPTWSAGGASTLLLASIVFLLGGIFLLLLLLLICNCFCKAGRGAGLPLPGLPDVKGIADILRGTATALRTLAGSVETANGAVDAARDKLKQMTNFKISVPKFRQINIPGFGDAHIPDGSEERSIFDADTEAKIDTFVDDATGETVLSDAAGELRAKADTLDLQADALSA